VEKVTAQKMRITRIGAFNKAFLLDFGRKSKDHAKGDKDICFDGGTDFGSCGLPLMFGA
jgi:hypothetical protein